MPSKKQYIITSITLGAIAAVSAGLIGVTNLVTRDQIKKNEINKINAGIREIFGKTAIISQEFNNKDAGLTKDYSYVEYVYAVNKDDNNLAGYAFKTSGSNLYGKISLIIGFTDATTYAGLTIVVNEQTYASTLEDNYIDPLNSGDRELDDVKCGATYGAKLVRDMVNEASEAAKEMWKV